MSQHLTPVPSHWDAPNLPSPKNVVAMAEGMLALCSRLAPELTPSESYTILAEMSVTILRIEHVESLIRARVQDQATRLGLMP